MRTTFATGLATVLALFAAGVVRASEDSLVVRIDVERPQRVLMWDAVAKGSKPFYRSPWAGVRDVAVSPRGRTVAVLEADAGVVEGGEYARPPRSRLRVLDARGKVLREVADDVQHFTWSPDGRRLAYVTGEYAEGGVGFAPRAGFILDVGSGKKRPLAGVEHPYELHWLTMEREDALFARALVAEEGTAVLRFDVASGAVARHPGHAFHFSPDGEYYLVEPSEAIEEGLCRPSQEGDSCLRVFERRSDKAIAGLSATRLGESLGWAGTAGHQLLFSMAGAAGDKAEGGALAVVDAGSGKVVERLEDRLLARVPESEWITAGGRLLRRLRE